MQNDANAASRYQHIEKDFI